MEGSFKSTKVDPTDILLTKMKCQIHSDQPIVAIHQHDLFHLLKCFSCFQEEKINIHHVRDQESLRRVLKQLLNSYENLKEDSNLNIDLIDKESEIKDFEQKAKEIKEILTKKFEQIQSDIIKQFDLHKERLFAILDHETQNFKSNISSYNNIVKQYSGIDKEIFTKILTELAEGPNIQTCNNYISQIFNFEEFELISSTHNQLNRRTILEKLKASVVDQLESMKNGSFFKKTVEALNNVEEGVIKQFKPIDKIQSNIKLLSVYKHAGGFYESSILMGYDFKKFHEIVLTKFSNNFKAKLLYRGSRDGFSASAFHQKCNSYPHTLTIVKSTNYDEIFGGYADVKWDSSNKYIPSSSCWLFSLHHGQTYTIKINENALYCHSGYGPTFGSGHDLYIANNCDQNYSSYSNLGPGYGNTPNTHLGSTYNITVKDIEVYALEF